MPSMANITIKKADGTTDVVFSSVQPASGGGIPAIWRSPGGTAIAHQPTFTLSCKDNAARTVTRMRATINMPETAVNSTTSITSVVNNIPFSCDFVLPKNASLAITTEAIHQMGNLLSSTLVRSSLVQASAPN